MISFKIFRIHFAGFTCFNVRTWMMQYRRSVKSCMSQSALHNLDRYCIIHVHTLKPAKCVLNITYTVGSDLSGNLIYPTEDRGTKVLHTIV